MTYSSLNPETPDTKKLQNLKKGEISQGGEGLLYGRSVGGGGAGTVIEGVALYDRLFVGASTER